MAPAPSPAANWGSHSKRVLELVDHQVRNLRKRQVVGSFEARVRQGTDWGIRTDNARYQLPDALSCPHASTMQIAETPTRLAQLDDVAQERLINWGYAVCDAAMRRHVEPTLPPGNFPYSRGV